MDTEAEPDLAERDLPVVETQYALAVLDSRIVTSADEEVVDFLAALLVFISIFM